MGTGLTFDEPTHTYRVDGRVVQSVTQILKRVYPNVYGAIPAHVLDRKARLGTAVHRAIDLFLRGMLDESSLHEEVRPYFDSWLRWWTTHEHRDIEPECQFYSPSGDYAGTRDFYGTLNGKRWLIDWKITSYPVRTHPIQLAAYHFGDASRTVDRAGNLYLSSDGSPARLDEHDTLRIWPDWAATLRVYHIQETMK